MKDSVTQSRLRCARRESVLSWAAGKAAACIRNAPRLITMSEGTDSQTSLSIEEEGSRTLADLPDSLLHEIFGHLDPGNT